MQAICKKSYKQNAPVIIDRSGGIVVAANRPVKCHNGGDRTVNLLCGFFLVRLDIASKVSAVSAPVIKCKKRRGKNVD